jgi:hypothetical protein
MAAEQCVVHLEVVVDSLKTIDVDGVLASLGEEGFSNYLAAILKFGNMLELQDLNKKPIEDRVKVAMQTGIDIFSAIIAGTIPRHRAEILLRGMIDKNNAWPAQLTTDADGQKYFFGLEEDSRFSKIMVSIVFAVLSRIDVVEDTTQ